MIKYCFFMTNQSHWLKVAKKLNDNNIAKPILWLGDDTHYEKAKNEFGEGVVKMLDFVHKPYDFSAIEYDGKFSRFLVSENYVRAKDKCLKMMDRLDLNSAFNRLDKEVFMHNIIIWTLKRFRDNKPDVLISVENPHSHAQYIIHEICDYLEIPIFTFNSWMPVPLLFLKKNLSNYKITKPYNYNETNFDNIISKNIDQFIDSVLLKKQNFEMFYMRIQRQNAGLINRIKSYFLSGWKEDYNDIKHNSYMLLNSKYNPINPYRYSFITRKYIRSRRIKNLKIKEKKSIDINCFDRPFAYFPLHFEPERTTNPDGGVFHDQFIALSNLRNFIPNDINILVKEHPSQFLMSNKGSKGRSPMFYDLIKNINGVKIVDSKHNSIDLILKSNFLATISGSVALEGAILGKKAIIFGDTWFNGCPNIFNWKDNLDYSSFVNDKSSNDEDIKLFLKKLMKSYSIPAFQNLTKRKYFKNFNNEEFENNQIINLYNLLEEFFNNKLYLK